MKFIPEPEYVFMRSDVKPDSAGSPCLRWTRMREQFGKEENDKIDDPGDPRDPNRKNKGAAKIERVPDGRHIREENGNPRAQTGAEDASVV